MHDDDQHQRGLRILAVDDNHDAASSMSALLELQGHRTSTAHNGLEAVREATPAPTSGWDKPAATPRTCLGTTPP